MPIVVSRFSFFHKIKTNLDNNPTYAAANVSSTLDYALQYGHLDDDNGFSEKIPQTTLLKIENWAKADKIAMANHLGQMDWEKVLKENKVEPAWQLFKKYINLALTGDD